MPGKIKHAVRLLLLLIPFIGQLAQVKAQNPKPVKWSFVVKQVNATEAELIFNAIIEKGYHVYSQDVNPDVGPIPTAFVFTPDKNFALSGKVTEGKSIEIFDENFGIKLKYFTGQAIFVQKINLKSKKNFQVKGTLTYMVCDDSRCYPPEDMEFSFDVGANGSGGTDNPVETPGKLKDNKQ